MILSRWDHLKTITIWTPRYHDHKILINADHLDKRIPHYQIVFTKAKHLMGANYYLSYKTIKKSKKEWHKSKDGRDILRYAVPESKLETLMFEQNSLLEVL